MTDTEGSYYVIHRSTQGTRKRAAWFRARQRTLSALANEYPSEFRRIFDSLVDNLPTDKRRTAREATLRELRRRHPIVFRRMMDVELAQEPHYQVKLKRGPKPKRRPS